jgi:hypothetical protein
MVGNETLDVVVAEAAAAAAAPVDVVDVVVVVVAEAVAAAAAPVDVVDVVVVVVVAAAVAPAVILPIVEFIVDCLRRRNREDNDMESIAVDFRLSTFRQYLPEPDDMCVALMMMEELCCVLWLRVDCDWMVVVVSPPLLRGWEMGG